MPRRVQGTHEWGAYFHTVERYGVVRRQVIVYPPGISPVERRWLRAWRAWPVVGVAVVLMVAVALSDVVPPSAGMGVGLASALAVGGLLAHRARRTRRRVRSLGGIEVPGMPDPVVRRRFRGALAIADDLAVAEEAWRRGELPRVGYEQVWHAAYDEAERLGPRARGRRAEKPDR
jgi:hypothetical protein